MNENNRVFIYALIFIVTHGKDTNFHQTKARFFVKTSPEKEAWLQVRKDSLYNYFNLPPQAQAQAEQVFDGMRQLANECSDQGRFEQRLAASPLSKQYTDLFTQFAKYVKLPEGTPTKGDVVKGIVADTAASSAKTFVRDRAQRSYQCVH